MEVDMAFTLLLSTCQSGESAYGLRSRACRQPGTCSDTMKQKHFILPKQSVINQTRLVPNLDSDRNWTVAVRWTGSCAKWG